MHVGRGVPRIDLERFNFLAEFVDLPAHFLQFRGGGLLGDLLFTHLPAEVAQFLLQQFSLLVEPLGLLAFGGEPGRFLRRQVQVAVRAFVLPKDFPVRLVDTNQDARLGTGEDFLADDDRDGVAEAGHRGPPNHVFLRSPFARRLGRGVFPGGIRSPADRRIGMNKSWKNKQ